MTADSGERVERRPLEGVAPVAAVVLWLLAAGLLTRQAVAVLRLPPERRLTDLVAWLGERGALSGDGTLYADGRFTGTPLAGLLLRPLAGAGDDPGLGVVWTGLGLLLVAGLGMLVVRALPGPRSRRWALLPLPAVVALLMVSLPVRDAFSAGGTGLVPVLLALAGFLAAGRYARFAGVLLGLAAALEPPLLLFAVVLWWASARGAGPGRRTAALWAGGAFAVGTVLAWAVLPSDAWTYWVHHVAGVGLGAAPGDVANQSLHGLLLRLGFTGPLEPALWAVLAGVVAALGLRRAGHYARDGQWLLAAAVTGCTAVAVSPVAWPHLHLWVLLAAVGRVGRRKGDRYVWPVFVVLVLTMDGAALVPHIAWLAPFGENATLLAALLAACVLPFVSRRSEVWARPEPSGVFSRPNLMLELLLIRVGYFAYSYVRSLAAGGREAAEAHGAQILALERPLWLDVEHGLNQFVAASDGLTKAMNFYYGAFHFLVPIALLAVLYLRRPATYRWARTALSFATLLGLVGFWLYPLAPPRLMPGLGYVDTAHGPQDFDDPDFGVLTGISNQYAAMPSLHVGWSLWAAVVVVRVTPALWPRLLAVLYPVLTTVVVMGTANHYLLDAVGGAAVVAGGFGVAALWRHHTAGVPESGGPAEAHASGTAAAPPAARAPAERAEPLTDPGAAVR